MTLQNDNRLSVEDMNVVVQGRGSQSAYEDALARNAKRHPGFYAIRVEGIDVTTTVSKIGDETSIILRGATFAKGAGARDYRFRLLFKDLDPKRVPVLRDDTLTLDLVELFFDIQHLPVALIQLGQPQCYVIVKDMGTSDASGLVVTPHFSAV